METIEQALVELAAGRPVVVVDGEDRENEGDLVVAADRVTPATMAFVVRHTSGYVCIALPTEDCDRLALPAAHPSSGDQFGTAYRVSVDAAHGIGTGISARDRAHTARVLAAQSTQPADLTRPGHVVPLAARPGGVLERGGHTEAAVDLTRLAGMRPAGVLCEVVSARDVGRMACRAELVDFAAEHGLAMIAIEDLVDYRRRTETVVERLATVELPTDAGGGRLLGYRSRPDDTEHVAFVAGDVAGSEVAVHVHSECVLGDVFGSRACECASRLDEAQREVAAARRGVVIYLRPGTRRPVGALLERMEAHQAGVPGGATASSIHDPGASLCGPIDTSLVVSILADLGVTSVRHLRNPPATRDDLDAALAAASSRAHIADEPAATARAA